MISVSNGYVVGNLWFATSEEAEQFEIRENIYAEVMSGYAGRMPGAHVAVDAVMRHIKENYLLEEKNGPDRCV